MFGLTMRLEESRRSTLILAKTTLQSFNKITILPNSPLIQTRNFHFVYCFQISHVQIFENKKQSDMIFLHFLIHGIQSLYSFRA